MLAPASDQDLNLPQRIKDLPIEKLVPELAVGGLVVSVLPRTARFFALGKLSPKAVEMLGYRHVISFSYR